MAWGGQQLEPANCETDAADASISPLLTGHTIAYERPHGGVLADPASSHASWNKVIGFSMVLSIFFLFYLTVFTTGFRTGC